VVDDPSSSAKALIPGAWRVYPAASVPVIAAISVSPSPGDSRMGVVSIGR
jgi:hypothetical protein